MSTITNGKTYCRIPHFIRQDPLLTINCKSHERDYLELFDQTYYNNVSYSMKKKNRWMLATLLTKEFYDQDDVIIYTEHQSFSGSNPINTIYLYDSLSQREFGCPDISNDKIIGKSINDKSVIHSIENEHHYTKQELRKLENLKNRKIIKTKKSRKHHRSYIPKSVDTLISKEEYLSNIENRKDCIYIDTNVHINDKSKVNFLKKACIKDYRNGKKETKFMRKHAIKDELLMNKEEFDDEFEDEFDDEFLTDGMIEESDVNENAVEIFKKDFSLNENDFLCKNLNHNKMKVKHKEKKCQIPTKIILNKIIVNADKNDEKRELFIDLKRDVLPFIEIDIPIESFIDDLDVILEIAQCWYSNTLNKSILIDLSNLLGGNTEDFLLLKPKFFKEDIISLKIIFNLINFNFNDILDKNFEKITEIIQTLQITTQPIKNESTITRKVMTLDKPNECLDGIWKTKILENYEKIHLYHDEWKKYILNNDAVDKIVSSISNTPTYLLETCEICFNEICENEMVIVNGCQHKICEECLSCHLIYRLETGMKILNCPGTECKSEIDCVTILQCVSWKRYRKRIGKLEETVIQKMGISCVECGTVTIMNDGDSMEPRRRLDYKCNCGRIICSLCGRNQHWPSSCYEFRKHNQKLKALRDADLFTENRPQLIFEGINCPKCLYFVVKTAGCNHMSCNCGAHFCWLCGDSNQEGKHLTSGFPCYKPPDNNHLIFDLTYIRPGPSEFRPKLYILSLEQKANNSEYSRRKLFYQLNLAFNSKSKFDFPQYTVKQLEHQFKQLVNITENVFVKAYQLDKRKHVKLKKYLKAVASMLIHYQHQIKLHIETISYMAKYSQKSSKLMYQMKEKWMNLIDSLSDAKHYIKHMHLILRN